MDAVLPGVAGVPLDLAVEVGNVERLGQRVQPALHALAHQPARPARYPKLQQIMQAAKKTVTTWGAADLGLDASSVGAAGAKLKLVGLAQPAAGGAVQIIEGETPEEQATRLVAALREARII